ncbi:hypothetical protein COLO4_25224 [Corchorus olitorius]|uniref:Uncharacterized protein n=1 Tax=Corchorus olitorius TaxID=93759 RepID=A0A1R3I436_9ROSI|nr:hypothetical protein COLO4_25224 [Corchorus olitorius]
MQMEFVFGSSVPRSGCAVTTLIAAESDTNMTGLDSDFEIPGAVCGDDGNDRFWETTLAHYQQILAHHNNLIDGVALSIEHILSEGSQLPIVGKADVASNRFRRKLYLANKAHTVYRQYIIECVDSVSYCSLAPKFSIILLFDQL